MPTPDIAVSLQPIEDKIRNLLIPSTTGRTIRSDLERSLFSLPAKLGGLAIINPVDIADTEYRNSLMANRQLTENILKQHKSDAKHKTPAKMYGKHEREKDRKYGDRCTQIKKGTCDGLVFSTTGGMGPQATMFLKRVATLLAAKTGQDKSLVMANLRRRLRFELLKTVLIAVRGHRERYYQKAIPVDELDLNLVHTTNDEDNGDDVDDVDDDNDEDDEDEDVEDEDVEE